MKVLTRLIFLAALVWLGVYAYQNYVAPKNPQNTSIKGDPVSFIELAHGTQSEVSERANYIITSTEQLRALWRLLDTPSKVPTVDFEKSDVVAVFMGDQPTTGYDIKISAVEDSEERTVFLSLAIPGTNCFAGQALTSPYQIIEVPKTALPMGHKDEENVTRCLLQ
jgi:hypothetical protein